MPGSESSIPGSELSELVARAYAAKVGLSLEQVRAAVISLHMIAGIMLLGDAELRRLADA
jgi:hypothetical protein